MLCQYLLVGFAKSYSVLDHFQYYLWTFQTEKVITPVIAVTKCHTDLPLLRLGTEAHRDRIVPPEFATSRHRAYHRVRVFVLVIDRLREHGIAVFFDYPPGTLFRRARSEARDNPVTLRCRFMYVMIFGMGADDTRREHAGSQPVEIILE